MIFGREPALVVGAVQAVLAVAVGFGLDLSAEQTALVLGAVAAVLSLLVRSRVSPAPSVLVEWDHLSADVDRNRTN